jgi:multicomponent Na+:H+ antiporter subunit D
VHAIVPLTVAVPLLAAALIAATAPILGPRAEALLAIGVALANAGMCSALVVDTAGAPIHEFFGGWQPRHGLALGVAFSVEPLAAGLAGLAAALTVASLVFSWRYFADASTLFHVLVLGFLAGMTGFALSADLFTMFVFFELMGVCAFALTGYRVDQPGPLQGSFGFAVTNSIAAFLILTGIGLLYGRTGALNLAQIGQVLSTRPADGLVIVAFTLIVSGFLVKAGIVPFHFWLSDAYAVAPIPVVVLLSGAMSDMGIHGVSRVYWAVFSSPFAAHAHAVRGVLVAAGLLSALLGAVMSFLEADLKRMLAFVTISHAGLFLAGTALLTNEGLAGTTLAVVADGAVKGALLLALGVVIHQLRSGDELTLRGRGRRFPLTATLFLLAAIGLAAPPPFSSFLGRALIYDSATAAGWSWLGPLLALAAAVAAGSALRAWARVFLGLGRERDPLLTRQRQPEEEEEPKAPSGRKRWFTLSPVVALLVVAFGLGLVPGIAGHATQAAAGIEDRRQYAAEVLYGARPPARPVPSYSPSTRAWVTGALTLPAAVAVAGFGLYRRRLPGSSLSGPAIERLKAVHSGVIGDYVAWLTAGTAVLGGLFALTLR